MATVPRESRTLNLRCSPICKAKSVHGGSDASAKGWSQTIATLNVFHAAQLPRLNHRLEKVTTIFVEGFLSFEEHSSTFLVEISHWH